MIARVFGTLANRRGSSRRPAAPRQPKSIVPNPARASAEGSGVFTTSVKAKLSISTPSGNQMPPSSLKVA